MFNQHERRSFRDGDIIFVDPAKDAENGSLVIAKLVDSQEATFKQLVMEGSRRFLKPLNPAWPEPIIELGADAIICGVVFSKLEIF
jgi:SOS-response transcriptional repressor LexA